MERLPYPSEEANRFQVRMPDGMREEIRAAAARNERSMNSEIIARLQGSSNSASNSLTKREHFAGLAMQALMPNYLDGRYRTVADMMEEAAMLAEALVRELAKGGGEC